MAAFLQQRQFSYNRKLLSCFRVNLLRVVALSYSWLLLYSYKAPSPSNYLYECQSLSNEYHSPTTARVPSAHTEVPRTLRKLFIRTQSFIRRKVFYMTERQSPAFQCGCAISEHPVPIASVSLLQMRDTQTSVYQLCATPTTVCHCCYIVSLLQLYATAITLCYSYNCTPLLQLCATPTNYSCVPRL